MATFQYRCTGDCVSSTADARFEVHLPIGTAPRTTSCPTCGSDAVRVYSPPLLSSAAATRMQIIDHAQRSRFEPAVVDALPGGPRRRDRVPAESNPALRRLPRP